ncbi:MAG: hypothetical protein AAF801_06645 [Pseudomonadota bacterium]
MQKMIDPLFLEAAPATELIRRYTAASGPLDGLADIRLPVLQRVLHDDTDGLLTTVVSDAQSALEDPEVAFAAIDMPSVSDNPQTDALLGCLLATTIQTAISTPVIDRHSGTPFSLYNASQENEAKLVDAGLKFYSPEDRLGFHSDGLITEAGIHVPKFVSVYNLMIAYRQPGNFYFLPFAVWDELAKFRNAVGVNRDVTFSMTPIVHALDSGEIKASQSNPVTAPLFWQDGDAEAIFYNGEIDTGPKELIELADQMRQSLLDNPRRMACPIRNRRMFIMANDKGVHARDVFADPILGTKYTRSFLRYVSQDAHCVKAKVRDHAA